MNKMRPRKTREQWSELIEQQQQSELTILEFCHKHDVGFASFGKWRKRLCSNSAQTAHSGKKAAFTPLSVKSSPARAIETQGTATITLSMGSGMTLTIVSPSSGA
jgi:hypothetical protein